MTPADTLALERDAVILPRTPARHIYDLNKVQTVTITMWGFCSYPDCDPAPKNLVFQHEVN